WYITLNEDITLTELKECIKAAPTYKATGPQHISNEMLKHLNDTTLTVLLHILNSCLQIQNIPVSWKHNLIYPISKKETFTGQLDLTRPISLIEHTRKILTKIITTRLSKICTRYPILNEYNYVALPGNSTGTSI